MATVVSSGQTVQNVTVSGYQEIISSGGTGKYQTVIGNGEIVVRNGGLLVETNGSGNWIINDNGKVVVESGGVVSGGSVGANGTYFISAGGIASGANIGAGGSLKGATGAILSGQTTVTSGGSVSGGTVASSGTLVVGSGATSIQTTVASGGNIRAAGTVTSAIVQSGGTANIISGGKATSTTVQSSGILNVASGGTLGTTTVSNGGVVSAVSGSTISGVVTLVNGATATIPSTAGGTVDLSGTNANLIITGSGSPTTVISGFTGTAAGDTDGITLANVKTANVSSVTYPDANHVTLTLKDGSAVTLNIIGVQSLGYALESDNNGNLVYAVCFLEDTQITVPGGLKSIQDITVGDEVVISRNGVAVTDTITWVGKAHWNVRTRLPDDQAGYPVRIRKDAISEGVPFKDLLVTAEHCLFLDGYFVPARMLVNGRSIFYDKTITSYNYYHIETSEHSIVSADGLLTESYLDTGNRRNFSQGGKVVQLAARTKSWDTDAAAPLTVAQSIVEPIHQNIAARAEAFGYEISTERVLLTDDADIHLRTNTGHVIKPVRKTGNTLLFMITGQIESVRILSNASRPCDVVGPFVDDRRTLGVLVGNVTLYDSQGTIPLVTHLEDSALPGWNNLEAAPMRWTSGDASLPLYRRDPNALGMLAIQIHAAGPYIVESQEPFTLSAIKA
ncbi:hypothetical protein BAR24_14725 [Gluconobacter oxydans]|uniref:Hint domain-containing protein n=1 Tax=Gluconobacter thailandicus TaxID=257438 RepID=UPI00029982CA|nr:Hint domain-containing protein [Gluconobacter thailandicus]AFW01809.1 outer membrane protein [Gluconobacter oxydans H24]ANQ42595.1 hypothetical protein BAR24_14725 [Gluconobacter oxydans]